MARYGDDTEGFVQALAELYNEFKNSHYSTQLVIDKFGELLTDWEVPLLRKVVVSFSVDVEVEVHDVPAHITDADIVRHFNCDTIDISHDYSGEFGYIEVTSYEAQSGEVVETY